MARVRPLIVARNLSGRVVPNSDIYIYDRDDTEVVADHTKVQKTLYTTEAGGTTIAQPLQTDSRGICEEFWMEPASYDRRIDHANDDFIVHDEALSAQDLGGHELGSVEITSDFSTTSTTPVDVTAFFKTVTVGASPIKIELSIQSARNSVSSGTVAVYILEDGVIVASAVWLNASANSQTPISRKVRRNPAAGDHTYKVQMAVASGTGTLFASAASPALLDITTT